MNIGDINEKISKWFKRVMNIINARYTLETLGIQTACSEIMTSSINMWNAMYRDKKGLCLPSAIASEVARLVTVELQSEITGSQRAEYLNGIYKEFLKKSRNITEFACASGGVVLKPYVSDNTVKVAFVRAENFIPTQFDVSGNLTGIAFIDKRYKDDKIYTRVEHHNLSRNIYVIKNNAFVSTVETDLGKKIALNSIEEWSNIENEVKIENIKTPLFAYFKMPSANTIDVNSPLGVSAYANAVGLIGEADKLYDELCWEFKSGARALYVDNMAIKHDKDGNPIVPDERLYKLLNSTDLFKEWSPNFREQNLINGINAVLRKIEFNVGLAYGTLSDTQQVDKTAEEIKASKQRSYTNVTDIQSAFRDSFTQLAKAMDILADLYSLAPSGDWEISFQFDDSIIADRKTEFAEKLQLVNSGIMQKYEFRMWYFGEDEETAKARAIDMTMNEYDGAVDE